MLRKLRAILWRAMREAQPRLLLRQRRRRRREALTCHRARVQMLLRLHVRSRLESDLPSRARVPRRGSPPHDCFIFYVIISFRARRARGRDSTWNGGPALAGSDVRMRAQGKRLPSVGVIKKTHQTNGSSAHSVLGVWDHDTVSICAGGTARRHSAAPCVLDKQRDASAASPTSRPSRRHFAQT